MIERLLDVLDGSDPNAIVLAARDTMVQVQESRKSLESTSLSPEVQQHLRWELSVYWRCFDEMNQWLSRIADRAATANRTDLNELATAVEILDDRFRLATALFCQARDAELGPTPHPSPNRLLACSPADYAGLLRRECAWVETERRAAVLPEQKKLLDELLLILQVGQPQLRDKMSDWAPAWIRADLTTFQRRNQWKPFAWPVLNLALNALWAFEQDQVEESLTQYFCDLAQAELSRMPGGEDLARAIESPDTTSKQFHFLLVKLQSGVTAKEAICVVCQLPWAAGQKACPGCGSRSLPA